MIDHNIFKKGGRVSASWLVILPEIDYFNPFFSLWKKAYGAKCTNLSFSFGNAENTQIFKKFVNDLVCKFLQGGGKKADEKNWVGSGYVFVALWRWHQTRFTAVTNTCSFWVPLCEFLNALFLMDQTISGFVSWDNPLTQPRVWVEMLTLEPVRKYGVGAQKQHGDCSGVAQKPEHGWSITQTFFWGGISLQLGGFIINLEHWKMDSLFLMRKNHVVFYWLFSVLLAEINQNGAINSGKGKGLEDSQKRNVVQLLPKRPQKQLRNQSEAGSAAWHTV